MSEKFCLDCVHCKVITQTCIREARWKVDFITGEKNLVGTSSCSFERNNRSLWERLLMKYIMGMDVCGPEGKYFVSKEPS